MVKFEFGSPVISDFMFPKTIEQIIIGDWNSWMAGNGDHAVVMTSRCCVDVSSDWEVIALSVNGSTILNVVGTNRSPLILVKQFLIHVSPRVFGREILGFGNYPFQGFTEWLKWSS
jgi:hypothetical protein